MTIKDKLLASCERRATDLQKEHADIARKQTALEQNKAWIDGMPELDIPEPDYASIGYGGNDIFLTYHKKGQAQEAAVQAAILLGITFTKAFSEYSGQQLYYCKYGVGRLYISGAPPESCKLKSYEVIEKRTRYKVNCEEVEA